MIGVVCVEAVERPREERVCGHPSRVGEALFAPVRHFLGLHPRDGFEFVEGSPAELLPLPSE